MMILGVTGTVAAGKSTVAEMFRELGAVVIDADRVGHEVLEQPEVRRALRRRWGERVWDGKGAVNRQAIAERVFGDDQQTRDNLQFLQSLTHPYIFKNMETQLREAARQGARVIVLDAALLCEAEWWRLCDLTIMVTAPETVRRKRARQRGWSDQQFAARQAAQWTEAQKRACADVVIDNSSTHQHMQRQVQAFWDQLMRKGISGFLRNATSRARKKADNS